MKQISDYRVRVYDAVVDAGSWVRTDEMAELTGVAPRTVQRHLTDLSNLGVLICKPLFNGFRYKINPSMPPKAQKHVAEMGEARNVFAMT